ncbi:hypothetical protein ACHHYP_10787 [Achlya hypogyna]|uniref:Uncharacterized protein n=1 Tax=Achlya hypogyna TaxID=1202772 RepID=A0A1V9YKS2_ACHHY|nr:hypothetical protein ACHHYP_10787 [Achlya hypogyna]
MTTGRSDEVGLIYLEDPSEAFVLEDHKLGVALDMIPALHREAKEAFFSGRKTNDPQRVLEASRAMLLVCADFYTAWNARKQLITDGYLGLLEEIQFMNVVLSHHSKSIDTWAHRRWVLTRLVAATPAAVLQPLLEQELALCLRLTEQYPRNYHAWSYRYCICGHLPPGALLGELQQNRSWCERHVADHSGWNHRQLLLLRLVNPSLLADEIAFHTPLLRMFPDREALWCHRRALLHGYLQTVPATAWTVALDAWCAAQEAPILSGADVITDTAGRYVATELVLATSLQTSTGLGLRYAVYALEAMMQRATARLPHAQELHDTLCRLLEATDPTHSALWRSKATDP